MGMISHNRSGIGLFSLFMINFAAIANVRNLPFIAPYGFSLVFFYALAAFLFLIPTALISAELASTFPEDGGIYNWVSRALGPRTGFFAVLLQNVNNFACFPMALSFVASTIAYGIFHSFEENRIFVIAVIFTMIWGGTLVTLYGVRVTGLISAVGSTLGTFLPTAIIVGLCVYWLASGLPSQIIFSTETFFPSASNSGNMSLMLGVLLGFAGLEMSANHIRDVKNPRKVYPRAIFLATLAILFVSILGSLAIAIVVPKEKLAIHAGAIQALSKFFSEFHIEWLTPIVSLLMVLGSIAWFCAWVSGPPRAMYASVKHGHLPYFFHKLNKYGMPTNIMLTQAVISTVLSFVFIFAESIGAAFVVLTTITAQFLLMMYILMFLSAIILRIKTREGEGEFHVPGGKTGTIVLSCIGLSVSLLSYAIGFFPPSAIDVKSPTAYTLSIMVGNIIAILLPWLIGTTKRLSISA
jgi:amino acid transporter